MLQYWSRLRVRLTLPDFEVLTYFQKVDSHDQRFTRILSSSDCEVNPIILPREVLELKELEHRVLQLPSSIVMILMNPEMFPWVSVSFKLSAAADAACNIDAMINLSELSLEELLYCTIVWQLAKETGIVSKPSTSALSEMAFTLGLQKLWMLDLKDDLNAISMKLIIASLFLHLWASHSHSLAILRAIDPDICRYLSQEGEQ